MQSTFFESKIETIQEAARSLYPRDSRNSIASETTLPDKVPCLGYPFLKQIQTKRNNEVFTICRKPLKYFRLTDFPVRLDTKEPPRYGRAPYPIIHDISYHRPRYYTPLVSCSEAIWTDSNAQGNRSWRYWILRRLWRVPRHSQYFLPFPVLNWTSLSARTH